MIQWIKIIGCHLLGFSLLLASFFLDRVTGSVAAAVALVFLAMTLRLVPPAKQGSSFRYPGPDYRGKHPRFQKKQYDLY